MKPATAVTGLIKRCGETSLLLFCAIGSSISYASDKLMVEYPKVVRGETEIGARVAANIDHRSEINNSQTWKFGAGRGFTDYWFSEVYLEVEKPAGESEYETEFVEWENLFLLTEPGRYWADWGLIVEYSAALEETGSDAYKLMPLVQKRFSTQMVTGNFGFERNQNENGTSRWQFNYALQYLWLGNPARQFAVEAYGELGDVNDWSPLNQQQHQFGPALVGKFKTSPGRGWEYRLGWFFGLTEVTPDQAFLANIEYEFF